MAQSAAVAFDEADIPRLAVIDNPGMISSEEEKLYFYLASRFYNRDRIFLEIGTWLGRSTQRICQGLSSRASDWTLYCYDEFKWLPLYKQRAADQARHGRRVDVVELLEAGESFQEAFLTLMGEYRPHIVARQGRLRDIASRMDDVLDRGSKVGVLFVDASKGWVENSELMKFIATRLEAGDDGSLLLFQDFFYFPAYQLIFLLQMVPEIVPYIYTSLSCSIVYRVARPIDASNKALSAKAIVGLSEADIYRAWERLLEYVPEARLRVRATHLSLPLMLLERKFDQAAERELARLNLSDQDFAYVRPKLAATKRLQFPMLMEMLGPAAAGAGSK